MNECTYSSLNPSTWRIRICLTMVLLPDSPAPVIDHFRGIKNNHNDNNYYNNEINEDKWNDVPNDVPNDGRQNGEISHQTNAIQQDWRIDKSDKWLSKWISLSRALFFISEREHDMENFARSHP